MVLPRWCRLRHQVLAPPARTCQQGRRLDPQKSIRAEALCPAPASRWRVDRPRRVRSCSPRSRPPGCADRRPLRARRFRTGPRAGCRASGAAVRPRDVVTGGVERSSSAGGRGRSTACRPSGCVLFEGPAHRVALPREHGSGPASQARAPPRGMPGVSIPAVHPQHQRRHALPAAPRLRRTAQRHP